MNIRKNRSSLTEKQKKIIGLTAFLAFLAFCAVVTWFIGRPMINFVSEPEKFRTWVDSHGIFSYIAFLLMVIFQVVIALVPGEPLEIGAGYAFGAIEGTLLCVAGVTVGSVVVFLLVRKFGIRLVEVFFSKEKIRTLKFLNNEKRRNFITFIVFLLPGTPKDLLTYFVGVTDIKMSHFLVLAAVARIPSIVTSTVGGSALGVEKYTLAIIVFSVTLVISGVGLLVYNLIQRHRNKQ